MLKHCTVEDPFYTLLSSHVDIIIPHLFLLQENMIQEIMSMIRECSKKNKTILSAEYP